MDEGKQTFLELLVGICIFGVLLIIPGLFWPSTKYAYYIGLVIGIILSLFLAYDMYTSLDKGLSMDSKGASAYIRKKALLRLAIVIVIFFVSTIFEQVHIIGVLLGALTLKFSAFLQPLTHKFLAKNK